LRISFHIFHHIVKMRFYIPGPPDHFFHFSLGAAFKLYVTLLCSGSHFLPYCQIRCREGYLYV
jgi:hypothetical protein